MIHSLGIRALILSGLLMVPGHAATQLVLWTFGASAAEFTTTPTSGVQSGTASLSLGGGELDANGKDGTPYTDIVGMSHEEGQAAAWEDIKVTGPDAEILIQFSTLGYRDIAIRFDYRSEAAEAFDFAYESTPDTWVQLHDNEPITVGWSGSDFSSFSSSFSGTTAIENNPSVTFRIDDLEEGNGNDRFAIDNFEITGTAIIPEPSTTLLMMLGLGAFGTRRRR